MPIHAIQTVLQEAARSGLAAGDIFVGVSGVVVKILADDPLKIRVQHHKEVREYTLDDNKLLGSTKTFLQKILLDDL